MFAKELEVPTLLLQSEVLEGRYLENKDTLLDIQKKIKILKSGYNGEKTINYHLRLLPNEKYVIFHDLRLSINNTYFQIDVLLLSTKFILILESKNHSGTLKFEKNQMIQEYNDSREVYENPITQVARHKILLKYLFGSERIPNIPIEYYVVVCKSSTEIIITTGYTEAEERVIKASDVLRKIDDLEKIYIREYLSKIEIEDISELLIKKHTPPIYNVLKVFGIPITSVITGVNCPNCSAIPMQFKRKKWICSSCQFSSKDAHLKAIMDYFLIVNASISNSDLRMFLHLPSSRSATYIFSLLGLPYKGKSRDRVYFMPDRFPFSTNHVFSHKTNTIKKQK